jgi:hypothetical protein
MRTTELLHYACRARNPEKLGMFYADLFEGQFLVQPIMAALGIALVKLNHPEALFDGLLEFWPWDVIWDSRSASFAGRAAASPTSYGHVAVKVAMDRDAVIAELDRRRIVYRIEPRPRLHGADHRRSGGNMIELFPNVDTMPVPPEARSPRTVGQVYAALRQKFAERAATIRPARATLSPSSTEP